MFTNVHIAMKQHRLSLHNIDFRNKDNTYLFCNAHFKHSVRIVCASFCLHQKCTLDETRREGNVEESIIEYYSPISGLLSISLIKTHLYFTNYSMLLYAVHISAGCWVTGRDVPTSD